MKGSACELVFTFHKERHIKCPEYYDGLFNTNLLSGMRGMMTVLDFYIKEWENERQDYTKFKKIFRQKKMISILSKFQEIIQTLYYWNAYDTSDMLVGQLKLNTEYLNLANYLAYPLIGLCGICLYVFFVARINEIMLQFYSVMLIIPFPLVESNTVIVHHLNKVRRGEVSLY